MRDFELSEVKRWAEEEGGEIERDEDYYNRERIRVVFERDDPMVIPGEGVVRRPMAYVETDPHTQEFGVEAGDSLKVTEEEWEDGEYEKTENVSSTGTHGAECHVNVWDGSLQMVEVAEDGWRHSITVEVKDDQG